ncbi:MAG: flagellar type III secretion system pore protein FliP [Planctomycetes bacterium]|nr:flagellar type III secretion system pore protein FliP [Planctomycetota bacterium]
MASCRTIRLLTLVVVVIAASVSASAQAQVAVPPSLSSPSLSSPSLSSPSQLGSSLLPSGIGGPQQWTSPEGLSSTLQVMILLTVISLAPAVLLMTTSFIRILVVLGLLRQALGTQQLPPSQVIASIALFITVLIMTPVWSDVYDQAIKPYTEKENNLEQAWDRGTKPVRRFMAEQIIRTENDDDVYLFLKYMPSEIDEETGELPEYVFFDQEGDERIVPLQALLPAYMLSELKTAFLIGFQIYLPFVILDIVVASVTISMGMLMLPPVLISLPFKLLLFVLVDG